MTIPKIENPRKRTPIKHPTIIETLSARSELSYSDELVSLESNLNSSSTSSS